jgi:HK97 family phage major capsid protein
LLYSNTVIFKLGARSVPMPNGNLTMAGLASSSTATYGGENEDTNASQPAFNDRSWQAKKLTAIVPVSNDLLRSASPRADQIVRDDAVMAVAIKMDSVALQSMGNANEPRGIKFTTGINDLAGITALTADDPAKFIKALLDSKIPMSPSAKFGWAFNPSVWLKLFNLKSANGDYYFREEMTRGMLLGQQFQLSQQIANVANITDVYYADWSELIVAQQSSMELAVSDSAAYLDSTGTMRASFARDQTLMRIIDRHDIGARRPAAFVLSNDVDVS